MSCRVENVDVENVDVENVDVENVDVENADVENADVENADVENVDVENADDENADDENADDESTDGESTNDESTDDEIEGVNDEDSKKCDDMTGAEGIDVELATCSIRSDAPTSRSRHRSATRVRRPRFGPIKQSAFVILIWKSKFYSVRNRSGKLGAPGGKREERDKSIWATAKREFREETNMRIPTKIHDFFEWGHEKKHSIRIYYRHLTDIEANNLPIGETNIPNCAEVETLWTPWDLNRQRHARSRFRPHIAKALAGCKAIITTNPH